MRGIKYVLIVSKQNIKNFFDCKIEKFKISDKIYQMETSLIAYRQNEKQIRGKKGTGIALALLKIKAESVLLENRHLEFAELSYHIESLEETQKVLNDALVIYNPCLWSTVAGLPLGASIGWCMWQFLKSPVTLGTAVVASSSQAISNKISNIYRWFSGDDPTISISAHEAAHIGAEAANRLIDAHIPSDLKNAYMIICTIICFSLIFVYIRWSNEKVIAMRSNYLKNKWSTTSSAFSMLNDNLKPYNLNKRKSNLILLS